MKALVIDSVVANPGELDDPRCLRVVLCIHPVVLPKLFPIFPRLLGTS